MLVALSTFAGCAWLDVKSRTLMYRPAPGRLEGFGGLRTGDTAYSIAVPGDQPGTIEQLAMWWMPSPDPAAPTLLYLHGTFRNLYRNYPKIEALRAAGFSVLAVDYRGWGDSTPIIPSQKTILADADVAWAELVRHQPLPNKRVIYGHSLGGAVAIDLASRKKGGSDYAALIVESTFTNLADLAASAAGPVGPLAVWISGERFDSLARIGRIDAPILMLHGDRDNTVPVALGRKLRDAAPPGTKWVEIPGGSHSRLHEEAPETYRQALIGLIAALPPSPSPSP
ncbi:MAG TPA: alpha/beta fold hydrolase [Caldimonas sp.]|nr:alpha/beta fold hydrolase [Caldimonas sp.]